jgi:hypothetical protein
VKDSPHLENSMPTSIFERAIVFLGENPLRPPDQEALIVVCTSSRGPLLAKSLAKRDSLAKLVFRFRVVRASRG